MTFGLSAHAQSEPTATVYIFTVDKGLCCDHFMLDNVDIGKISKGKVAKFSVLPGYHEVQAHLAGARGISSIKAEPGKEYYVQAEISTRSTFGVTGTFSFHLHPVSGFPSDEKLKQDKVSEKVLARVLEAGRNFQHSADPEQYISSTEPVGMLTDDEVAEAVLEGSHDQSVSNIGFLLNDTATNVMTHLDAAITNHDTGVSGFTIRVYSPKRWVEYLTALAHVQMRPFTVANVTPEMRSKYLRVVAFPSVPDRLNGENMSWAEGVGRVVATDASKRMIAEPAKEVEEAVTLSSAFRDADYRKIASAFQMNDIQKLQGANGDQVWYIAVLGQDGSRKYFQIKSRFRSWFE